MATSQERVERKAQDHPGRIVYRVVDALGKEHVTLSIRCKGRLVQVTAWDAALRELVTVEG